MARIYCVLLGMCFASVGAQIRVSGCISDTANLPLAHVNVFLKQGTSGSITVFTTTDNNGRYALEVQKPGFYILEATAFNYEWVSEPLELKEDAATVKNLRLNTKQFALDEVVIVPEKAIGQKRDTIVFDVKSFVTGNENVVEDLLKKIPGLTVSEDGAVKVGNKEVEKIMVEGDDFFEKGYRLLTKNMPSQPIDKVELYEHYTENDKLRGIEHTDKVALNLKLKDDVKRQWFGNADLGYGLVSENRYDAAVNAMNFGKESKFYLLSGLNNIGVDPVGELDQLIHPPGSEQPGEMGEGLLAQNSISMDAFKPDLSARRTDINNAEMLSLNHIFSPAGQLKIKTLAFLSADEQKVRNSYVETFAGPLQLQNTGLSEFRPSSTDVFGKVNLKYDMSGVQALEYTGKFHLRQTGNSKNVLFNGQNAAESLYEDKRLHDHKITLTRKLGGNSVLLFNARHTLDHAPQRYAMDQTLYDDLFHRSAAAVFQNASNQMQFSGAEVHILARRKNGHLLEFKLGDQLREDHLQTRFGLLVPNYDPPPFQNDARYRSNNAYIHLKYLLSVGKKFNLGSGIETQYLHNKISSSDAARVQKPVLVSPKIFAEWIINPDNRMVASYNYSQKNASVLEISGGYINTTLRNFSRGTGDFAQLANSDASIYYHYSNWSQRFFVNTRVGYVKNHDYFSFDSFVTQNYSLSNRILIKNKASLHLSTTVDRYLKAIRCNLKLAAYAQQSTYQNSVNNSGLRDILVSELHARLELRSGFKGFFNYHAGFKSIHNQTKTEIALSSHDHIAFADLYFVWSKQFDFQIKSERYYFGNLVGNKAYYFVDLEARYNIKPNQLTLSLCGNNLLNTKSFKTYTLTDVSSVQSEYVLQARYALLQLKIHF